MLTTRADDLLTRAGLSDVRDRLAGQLSGGMRKKLGFCLAMLHEPQLLILDGRAPVGPGQPGGTVASDQ